MSTAMVPSNMDEAIKMLESSVRFMADAPAAELPVQLLADGLRAMERSDAVEAVARGRFLIAFEAQDGPLADGQRNTRTWLVHSTRVTKGQAAEYQAIQARARDRAPLLAALAAAWGLNTSEALQLARWTRARPEDYRPEA